MNFQQAVIIIVSWNKD